MLQLIETICFIDGQFHRIPFHELRMNRSRSHFFGEVQPISLLQMLGIPESFETGTIKCRVTYSKEVESIEYETYHPRLIRSLRLVYGDAIDYSYKYKKRDSLEELLKTKGEADEILIIRNGLVTDTSFTNVAFLKEGIWYTPATPLLPGTRREYYITQKQLVPADIQPGDLYQYEAARLINAMLSLEDAVPISIANIGY
jgi:4-amino-4-deoxychorismate lyase